MPDASSQDSPTNIIFPGSKNYFKPGKKKAPYEQRLTRKAVAQGRAALNAYDILYPRTLEMVKRGAADYGDLFRSASDATRAHEFEAFQKYAPMYRDTIAAADPERAKLLARFNESAGHYLDTADRYLDEANQSMSPAARREIIQASLGEGSLAGFGTSPRDAALAYLRTGLTADQLHTGHMAAAADFFRTGTAGAASALESSQRALGDPFLAITGRPALPQGANIQSPDYAAFNNDIFSYGVNREIMDNNNAQARAARTSALIGAGIGAVGSLGGGALSMI